MINLDPAVLSATTASDGRPAKGGEFVALLARAADEQGARGGADETSLSADADLLDEAARQDAEEALAALTEGGEVDLDQHAGVGTALWLLHTALRAEAPASAGDEDVDTELARALAALAAASATVETVAEDTEVAPEDLDAADLPLAAEEEAVGEGAPTEEVHGTLAGDAELAPSEDVDAELPDDLDGDMPTGATGEQESAAARAQGETPPSGDAARGGLPRQDATTDQKARADGARGVVRPVEAGAAPSGDGEAQEVEESAGVPTGADALDEEPDLRGRMTRGAEPELGARESARPVATSTDRAGAEPVGTTPVEATPTRAGESAPTQTARTPGATMVERLLEAATRLENMPPPRTLTLEIGEARVRLSMEDGALRLQLLGQERAEDRDLLDDAAAELRSRGFELGGDGAEQNPDDQQTPADDAPSWRARETPDQTRSAYAPRNTTDLRL